MNLFCKIICCSLAWISMRGGEPCFQWARRIGGFGFDGAYAIAVDRIGNVYSAGFFQDTVDFDSSHNTYTLASNGGYDIYISKYDNSGSFVWARSIGGDYDDFANSLCIDSAGQIFVAGSFLGIVDFDPGPGTNLKNAGNANDIFILKVSVNGDFEWVQSFGDQYSDEAFSVASDSVGNVFLTGRFQGSVDFDAGPGICQLNSNSNSPDIFILKLSGAGNLIWAKGIGGTSSFGDWGKSLATDVNGNVVLTGLFMGVADFDPGPGTYFLDPTVGNMFILKLDTQGNMVFGKNFGTIAEALTTDLAGNIYVTGEFFGCPDFDPGPGILKLQSQSSSEIFILKLDREGNFVWAKAIDDIAANSARSIIVNKYGEVYSTGFYHGIADFDPGRGTYYKNSDAGEMYILKLTGEGKFSWVETVSGAFGCSIAHDSSGNIYSSGYFFSSSSFNWGNGVYTLKSAGNCDIFFYKLRRCNESPLTEIPDEKMQKNFPLKIFPNPVKDKLMFEVKEARSFSGKIEIFDCFGSLVVTNYLLMPRTSLDVTNLTPGFYTAKISGESKVYVKKIIKE